MSEADYEKIKIGFVELDSNGDGFITRDEYSHMFVKMQVPQSYVDSFIGLYDADGDGKIKIQEILRISFPD